MTFEDALVEARQHLYNYAIRLTHSPDDAEDIVSDTMLRALRHREKYRGDRGIKPWLFTIATNVFKDRKKKKYQPTFFSDLTDAQMDQLSSMRDVEAIYSAFTNEDVRAAIETLPGKLRHAVLLKDIAGMHHSEIGIILHMKTGAVRMAVIRGRRQLKEALAAYAPVTK